MKMMHSRLSRNGKSSNRGMTRSNQYEFHVKQYLAQIPTESGERDEREKESAQVKNLVAGQQQSQVQPQHCLATGGGAHVLGRGSQGN